MMFSCAGHAHVREANLDVEEGEREKAPARRLSLSRLEQEEH